MNIAEICYNFSMADKTLDEPKAKPENKPVRKKRTTTPKKKDAPATASKLNYKLIAIFGVLAVAAFLLALNFENLRNLFVVANVNGKNISRFQVIRELEAQGGQQVLDSIVSRVLIEQEAGRRGIIATDAEIQEEMARIDATLLAEGTNLDDALAAQNMTRTDLAEQLKFQVLLEKMLADRIQVTDEQLEDYIEANRENLPEEIDPEFREQLRESLVQQNMSMESQLLLSELRDQATINYYVQY
jgi:hypothetical protein